MRPLNKRAMYMSVGVFVVLLALFIIFQNRANVLQGEKDLVTDRAKIIVMDDFMKSFRDYYVDEILSAAVKPALEKMIPSSSPGVVNLPSLERVMGNESLPSEETIEYFYTTPNTLRQALHSLSFTPEVVEFSYKVDSISQSRYDEFEVNFLVDYKFSFLGNTWSAADQEVAVPVSVYSLWHPSYSGTYGPITETWIGNSTAEDCYIREVFPPGQCDCAGNYNIRPPVLVESVPAAP